MLWRARDGRPRASQANPGQPNPPGRSAQLLDLYEAKAQYGLQLLDRSASVDEISREAWLKHGRAQDGALFAESAWLPRLAEIVQKIKPLPRETGLRPVDDSKELLLHKEQGCDIEQLANYAHDGRIYVDSEILAALSPAHHAALRVHELIN